MLKYFVDVADSLSMQGERIDLLIGMNNFQTMSLEEIVERAESEAVQKLNEFDIKLKEKRYEVSLLLCLLL